MTTRVVLVAGAGGVGKTTLSAAVAVASAAQGARTLALTVDPARRLAQVMGIRGLGNDPTPVPGVPHLDAAMLDAAAAWEGLVHRHTDSATAQRLVTSRFFLSMSRRFPAGQAYAVAEETTRLAESSVYDTLVVDTPPIGGGIEFFDAASNIRTLLAGRALRVLTGPDLPGKHTLFALTGRPALRLADRILGGPLLADLAEFLIDLRTAYDGVRERALHVQELLDSADLVVVAAPRRGPVRSALEMVEARAAQVRALVLNRVIPTEWGTAVVAGVGPIRDDFERWAAEARLHGEIAASMTSNGMHPISIPLVFPEPSSVADLALLASQPLRAAVLS